MARHNVITLMGQVLADPIIIKNEATGEYARGICKVATLRSNREDGLDDENCRFDEPLIFTGDPYFAEQMAGWAQYDIVSIKGFITTKDINKNTICKHCGEKNTQEGVLNCISPSYVSVFKSNLNEMESLQELKKHREISNQALLIGYLTGAVQYYHPDGNYRTSLYQIAVNRKYYLKDDTSASRTDYPFIRTFSNQAKLDAQCLSQSSSILVDGFVQTKEFDRTKRCSHCDKEYTWTDNSMEIVGYAIEYLQNYKTPEDLESAKNEELERIKKKMGFTV